MSEYRHPESGSWDYRVVVCEFEDGKEPDAIHEAHYDGDVQRCEKPVTKPKHRYAVIVYWSERDARPSSTHLGRAGMLGVGSLG
jgi:hypothetical protein